MKRRPTSPGQILLHDYMEEWHMDLSAFSEFTRIEMKTLRGIIEGRERIDHTIATRLSEALNTSTISWLNLQRRLDAWNRENDTKLEPSDAPISRDSKICQVEGNAFI